MIRQFSAGGVVYRKDNQESLFLLCLSSPSTIFSSSWGLPKGWLDDLADGSLPGPLTLGQKRATDDQIREAALREVREEAGVEAKIISRLGTEQFFFTDQTNQKVFKTVIYFLMEYMRDLPEGFGSETCEIRWTDLDEANLLLAKRRGQYSLLKKAAQIISENENQ